MHTVHFPLPRRCLKKLTPERQGKLRIIAFPHVGGSAMVFQRWGKLLSQDIELFAVQYLGRADLLLYSQLLFPQSTCYWAPLAASQGDRDNWIYEQDLSDWCQIASREFQQHSFDSGQYLEEQCNSVVARLHRLLAGHLAPTNV
ncbi:MULTISPECIES: hypothetical protein [Photorhabdus]|uniref:Thioesterase n=2 Tax=Photorhabdus TaxID=29487 RepID=A0ABX0B464_9GAMM|nr:MULTISPECIES: hypothetical protein [Photorhabdus]MCC8374812.1 hypothetical protein [Photorhabdus bodei]MCT8352836.1 hypothetical protein [Photorhabdus kayaii]MDB6373907.1 hypothetical protein [Photorhabdus bodei]NDL12939.1 hypothetical protein [Photorhabdus kayaii]NDL26464.1 hypothetical protein [Photorhabdus kayaii]